MNEKSKKKVQEIVEEKGKSMFKKGKSEKKIKKGIGKNPWFFRGFTRFYVLGTL
ncbi:hypothetical protein [Salmonella sp. s59944]|uniref:hypothetical protein n=1 Tax=Salmonella sp. s59944 TaxID=3159720 RepID=UPI0039811239